MAGGGGGGTVPSAGAQNVSFGAAGGQEVPAPAGRKMAPKKEEAVDANVVHVYHITPLTPLYNKEHGRLYFKFTCINKTKTKTKSLHGVMQQSITARGTLPLTGNTISSRRVPYHSAHSTIDMLAFFLHRPQAPL